MSDKGSRRGFLASGMVALGSLALVGRFWNRKEKNDQPLTTKLLSREGKLVEVAVTKIPKKKSIISEEQLVSWIWKRQTLT